MAFHLLENSGTMSVDCYDSAISKDMAFYDATGKKVSGTFTAESSVNTVPHPGYPAPGGGPGRWAALRQKVGILSTATKKDGKIVKYSQGRRGKKQGAPRVSWPIR
jgi:hypothetical protein